MSTNAKVKVEESALEKAMRLCKEVEEEEERERLKEEEVKRKEEADKKRRDEVEKYNKSVMREAEENRKKELKTKEEEALRLKEAKDKEEAVLLPASLSTSLPNLLTCHIYADFQSRWLFETTSGDDKTAGCT